MTLGRFCALTKARTQMRGDTARRAPGMGGTFGGLGLHVGTANFVPGIRESGRGHLRLRPRCFRSTLALSAQTYIRKLAWHSFGRLLCNKGVGGVNAASMRLAAAIQYMNFISVPSYCPAAMECRFCLSLLRSAMIVCHCASWRLARLSVKSPRTFRM